MSVFTNRVSHLGAAFGTWWLGELQELWQPLRRRMQRRRPALILDTSGQQWSLRLAKSGRVRDIGHVASQAGEAEGKKLLGAMLRSEKFHRVPLIVLIPQYRSLRKLLDLPSITESELRQALHFEIDRQTPFQPEEIYFDYRIVARRLEGKRVTVEFTAVPRPVVDAVLDKLRRWGAQVSAVDIRAENSREGVGLNLLRSLEGTAATSRRSLLNMAPTILFLLLLAAAFYLPLHQLAATDEQLAARVTEEGAKAKQTLALRDELEQTAKAANFLDARKTATPSVLEVLDSLTGALPDHTWLISLNQQENLVKIAGYSAAASELISLLGEVPGFENPTFSSPIVQDPERKLERFEISFEIHPSEDDEP